MPALFERIRQRVDAIDPEICQTGNVVLLFGKAEGNTGSGELCIVFYTVSSPQQQRRLARATGTDEQMVLSPAATQIFEEFIEERSARNKRSDEIAAF